MLKLTEKEVLALGSALGRCHLFTIKNNTPESVMDMLTTAQSAYEKIVADQLPRKKEQK